VADGLHYLHSYNIIHGDLKGVSHCLFLRQVLELPFTPSNTKANILVDEDCRARLTDFGLASVVRRDGSVVSLQDPDPGIGAKWAAPEVLRGEAVTREADIFAFAMVAIEVCAGFPNEVSQYAYLKQTFTGDSSLMKNYQDVLKGKHPQRPGKLSHDGLWSLVRKCWDQDPQKRPTTFELLDCFRES
jgi:serine/threonine protein kinase